MSSLLPLRIGTNIYYNRCATASPMDKRPFPTASTVQRSRWGRNGKKSL